MTAVDDVVQAVLASRRYRSVHPPLVRRLALAQGAGAGAGARPAERAELVKRTKRALHQIFGAYLPGRPRYDRILAELHAADSSAAVRDALRGAMAQHASTRERLDHLDRFYATLAEHVGTPRSVLDVACGLGPLAYPWWGLAPGTEVHAWDIDVAMVELVGACLQHLGLAAHAAAVDLLSVDLQAVDLQAVDLQAVDLQAVERWPVTEVALVLKTLPCLEQQQAGSSEALLAAIPAPRIVVSFPTRSLGGRAKGMRSTYAAWFESLLAARGWSAQTFEVGPELVYVVQR